MSPAAARRRIAEATDWRLYLVTDPHLGDGWDAVPGIVAEAVCGGVGVVQVRDKECDDDEFAAHAAAIAVALRKRGVELEGSIYTHEQLKAAVIRAKEAGKC